MSPVLANRIPVLNRWQTPLDFGKKYRGKRLLGDNKTWRGVLFGTLMAGLAAILLGGSSFYIGCTLGFGALAGDAVESFFKRRRSIDSGESWFFFDQTDYIFGGLIAVVPFVSLTISEVIAIFISYFGLHIIVAFVGYKLGLKDKPI